MAITDLTTLSACKSWLGYTDTANDQVVSQEITRVSSMVNAWLNGTAFVKTSRTEYYNGKGTSRLILRNFPVLSVSALTINSRVIPPNPTPPTGAGFFADPWDGGIPAVPQGVNLSGYFFSQGLQNIIVSYVTGYVQSGEAQTISSDAYQVVPSQPSGLCVADAGVTYTNGTALTPVTSNPAVGQYIPPNPNGIKFTNYYQFNAAEAGVAVLISYSFVPWSVEMVAKDLVGERVSYRNRIGLRSKLLGGQETMTFDINTVPKWAQLSLQPFANVVPL